MRDLACININSQCFLLQNCKIYLCATKYDMVQNDKKLRQVDYHTTTDYADGMWFSRWKKNHRDSSHYSIYHNASKSIILNFLLFIGKITGPFRTFLKSPWILGEVLEKSLNFCASPWKVLEFSPTLNVVAWKI